MKLVSIRAQNVKMIGEVEIKPGKITQFVGQNNNGKTTAMQLIEMAAKGSTDGSVVKIGETAAEIILTFDDETVVKRRIKNDGTQKVSVSKGDFDVKAPQSFLDNLFSGSNFNPMELLDPKKRNDAILDSIDIKIDAETLAAQLGIEVKDLPPLDYNQHGLKVIEQCHKYFYQRRAEANKDAAEKTKRWETYKNDLPPKSEVTISRQELNEDLGVMQITLRDQENEVSKILNAQEEARKAQKTVENYAAEIANIEAKIAAVQKQYEIDIATLNARKDTGTKYLQEAKKAVPNNIPDAQPARDSVELTKSKIAKVREQLAQVDTRDAIDKQYKMVEDLSSEVEKAAAFAEALTNRVDALAGKIKRELMSKAEMPIEGLEYRDGVFYVDGVSVDNLSTSKTLRLAIPIARKKSGKAKFICIDGLEALDEESFAELEQIISNDDYGYFVTKVGEAFKSTNSVVVKMENGAAVPQ